MVGLLDVKGKWRQIVHNCLENADLVWFATRGANMYDFLGILEVESGSGTERWLIFNEPGIEGDGLYTIEIKDVGKEAPPSAESVLYNGC